MSQRILVLQGGGEGAHAEDQALADYLIQTLGEPHGGCLPEIFRFGNHRLPRVAIASN